MVRTRTTSVKGPGPDGPANVLFKTWLVSRAATAVVDGAVAAAGLTADEFAIYSVLRAGPLTPTELATWMAAPPTTISSSVKRLEARGHVRREPHPADRRSYRLALTPAGRRAHQRAGADFAPVLAHVERVLGPDEAATSRALDRLRAAFDEVRAEPTA